MLFACQTLKKSNLINTTDFSACYILTEGAVALFGCELEKKNSRLNIMQQRQAKFRHPFPPLHARSPLVFSFISPQSKSYSPRCHPVASHLPFSSVVLSDDSLMSKLEFFSSKNCNYSSKSRLRGFGNLYLFLFEQKYFRLPPTSYEFHRKLMLRGVFEGF